MHDCWCKHGVHWKYFQYKIKPVRKRFALIIQILTLVVSFYQTQEINNYKNSTNSHILKILILHAIINYHSWEVRHFNQLSTIKFYPTFKLNNNHDVFAPIT